MRAFTQADQADFFGRTAVVQELLKTLQKAIFPVSTITFAANLKGTMTLSSTLAINKNLIIRGPATGQLTLRGTRDQGELISIGAHITVTIARLTFSDPTPQIGEPIFSQGNLTVDGCNITGNAQVSSSVAKLNEAVGGGIFSSGGTLIINNSTIAHNTINAEGSIGGGVANNGGTLTITNSQIVDNTVIGTDHAAGGGGVATVNSNKVTLTNTTIAGNTVKSSQSGGVAGGGIDSVGGALSITNSAISGNSVTTSSGFAGGGGIANTGHMTITGTTISHNTAKSSQNDSIGGGISDSGILSITDSTISDNSANASTTAPFGAAGGGITAIGTLKLDRTAIVGNTIMNNLGSAQGGGLFADNPSVPNATLSLTNCTIANNTSQ
ncbi:MAG TPA: hypothetical protein VH593_16170 [Ktedonobacteraceae bacterium]